MIAIESVEKKDGSMVYTAPAASKENNE